MKFIVFLFGSQFFGVLCFITDGHWFGGQTYDVVSGWHRRSSGLHSRWWISDFDQCVLIYLFPWNSPLFWHEVFLRYSCHFPPLSRATWTHVLLSRSGRRLYGLRRCHQCFWTKREIVGARITLANILFWSQIRVRHIGIVVVVLTFFRPAAKLGQNGLVFLYGSISASYAIVFLFAPEIFPTNIRNTTVGIVDAVARLGEPAFSFTDLYSTFICVSCF